MFRGRSIGGFLLRFLGVYALMMLPWPGLQGGFRTGFISVGNAVFGLREAPHEIRFRPLDGHAADVRLSLWHPGAQREIGAGVNSRQVAYLPTAVVVSLILATPIPWFRRISALFWGVVVVHAFVAFRLMILITYARNCDISSRLSGQQMLWDETVAAGVVLFGVGQAMSYIAPIIIWILVTVRRCDWERLPRKTDAKPAPDSNCRGSGRRIVRWLRRAQKTSLC